MLKKHITDKICITDARFTIDTGPDVNDYMILSIIDDGGGHYIDISLDGIPHSSICIDPDELIALATWAKSVCVELDKGEA